MSAIPRFALNLTQPEIQQLRDDLIKPEYQDFKFVEEFEKRFARYTGNNLGVFLPSARFGLYKLLRFQGFDEGSGVIVPAWTHYSVPAMIVAAKLKPLFADIEPGYYNMTPDTIPEEYWKKAKAIIITHLYGCPAPVEALVEKAKKHNLYIIEDCAQALGATIHGKPVGSFGNASYFSLTITKNLTTLKGGMVCSNEPPVMSHLRDTRTNKYTPPNEIRKVLDTCDKAMKFTKPEIFGSVVYWGLMAAAMVGKDPIHEKFDEVASIITPPDKVESPHPVQAILGMRKLNTLDKYNEQRNANGKYLLDHLKKLKDMIVMPIVEKGHRHIFMSFVLMVPDPWSLKKHLLIKGIDTAPGYLKNNASLEIFSSFKERCKNAEKMEQMQIHIPVYPGLKEPILEHIATTIYEYFSKQ